MEFKSLSHAQSLRVIGQLLEDLVATSFRICKRGNNYIILTDPSASDQMPVTKHEFLNTCTDQIPRPESFTMEVRKRMLIATSDIPGLDIRARLKRDHQAGMTDVWKLSSNLRVLGGYLDRKQVNDFTVSWLIDSVKVAIHDKEHSFSVHQNLYDLGVPMYLARSHDFGDMRKVTAA